MCQKKMTRVSFVCAQIQNRCPKSLSRFCLTFPKANLCRRTPGQVVKTVSNLCLSWRPRHLWFGERGSSASFLSLIHLKMGPKPKAGYTDLAPAETEPRPFTPGM
jgi:hypothetical protein